MDIVYASTPRRLDVSEDDDEEVIFAAGDVQDREALMTDGALGSKKSRSRGLRRRTPGVCAITVVLYLSFFGLGVVLSLLGPTLLDLAYQVNQGLHTLAFVFTARSVGYLFGSLIAGALFDKFDPCFLLAVTLLLTGIGTFIAPLWKDIALLAACISLQGISMGFLDTGGNVLLLRLWGKDNGPYMQALHFSFAAGALTAPLLAKPFISPAPDSVVPRVAFPDSSTATTSFFGNSTYNTVTVEPTASTTATNSTLPLVFSETFHYAYWIASLPLVIPGILFTVFAYQRRRQRITLQDRDLDGEEPGSFTESESSATPVGRWSPCRRAEFLCLLALFFCLYVGEEVSYGGFIFSYGVKGNLKMSTPDAALLTAVYWGAFAVGRGLAIPLAWLKVSPGAMLVSDLVGSLLAAILLVSFPSSVKLLWINSALMGLSLASVFPTAISWGEQYMTFTGRSASIFVIGAALGEMVVPLAVGNFGPSALMKVSTFIISLAILVFIVMCARVRWKERLVVKHAVRLDVELSHVDTQAEPLANGKKPIAVLSDSEGL